MSDIGMALSALWTSEVAKIMERHNDWMRLYRADDNGQGLKACTYADCGQCEHTLGVDVNENSTSYCK